MEPLNMEIGLTEPMKVKGIFGTVTLKKVLVLGFCGRKQLWHGAQQF